MAALWMDDPVNAHEQHGHEQRKVARSDLRMVELVLKNRDASCIVGRASCFNRFCRTPCCDSLDRFHHTDSHCVHALIVTQVSGNETWPAIVKTITINDVAELICEPCFWATRNV